MAASNNRIREYDTVHHLMNRIAHKVYILNDDDRNDFIEIIRRAAEFTGVQLIGWCLMTNHFHLLVYLPVPIVLDEVEVLRRYGVLKGQSARLAKESELARLRTDGCNDQVEEWLESQRKRMYDIGSFMKIAKQWFTEEYNRRYSHIGTLWEGEYISKSVKYTTSEMAKRLGYIHLNPIRAAMTDRYDGYIWSSFAAFKRGDPVAIAGMRFIYDDETMVHELSELEDLHVELLDQLLEYEKRARAEEIARRRAAGQTAPCDPLTSEALVIQAAAHLEEVRRAGASAWENRSNLFSHIELQIVTELYLDPSLEVGALVAKLSLPSSTMYRTIDKLKRKGVLERPDSSHPWIVHSEKIG